MRSPRLIGRTRKRRPKREIEPPTAAVIARHGSLLILEVRDERGRRALRYVHD
jgi:hypothetical protein